MKRIDGTEVPLRTPWRDAEETASHAAERSAFEAARSDAPPVSEVKEEQVARPAEGTVVPDETPISEPVPVGVKPEGLTEDEIDWVDDNLEGFKGRVTRDEWVAQARKLSEKDDS